jgi:hypothetical protein
VRSLRQRVWQFLKKAARSCSRGFRIGGKG